LLLFVTSSFSPPFSSSSSSSHYCFTITPASLQRKMTTYEGTIEKVLLSKAD
jgi:hypothetical protein